MKTCFIGPQAPPFNGDGVKNSLLKEGFVKALGGEKIYFFDTIRRNTGRSKYFFQLIHTLWYSNQIILSLNVRGRYFIVPFFYFINLLSSKRGVLYVMGGAMGHQLRRLPGWIRRLFVIFLNKLDIIFVQSEQLKRELTIHCVKNVVVVYNGRKDEGFRWNPGNRREKVVFVSRVTESKGVFKLIEAVNVLNSRQSLTIQLDIYGPVDTAYRKRLESELIQNSGSVFYKGVLNPNGVQKCLSKYHAFVLPTTHLGEGLPGVLIEAGFAGIPVVVTNINALDEFFTHEKSVLFVNPDDINDIAEKVQRLLENPALANRLGQGLSKAVERFTLDRVIMQSIEGMREMGWKFDTIRSV